MEIKKILEALLKEITFRCSFLDSKEEQRIKHC